MSVALGEGGCLLFLVDLAEYDQNHLCVWLLMLDRLTDYECPRGSFGRVSPQSGDGVSDFTETCFTCEENEAQGGEMT